MFRKLHPTAGAPGRRASFYSPPSYTLSRPSGASSVPASFLFTVFRAPRPVNIRACSLGCNYQSCDALQMNCAAGEQFGKRQMSDPNSPLSRSGIAVCKEIERLTGRPTYYYLYRDGARSRPADARRSCPICKGQWLMQKPLHGKFDFKCSNCRLLSNIAWNVR